MNALLRPLAVRALVKPNYVRWDLIRTNERDAWVRENSAALKAWYADTAPFAGMPQHFEVFATEQFAFERDHFEQLRDDAKLSEDYAELEDNQ